MPVIFKMNSGCEDVIKAKTVAEKPTEANNGEAEAKKDQEKNGHEYGENFLLFLHTTLKSLISMEFFLFFLRKFSQLNSLLKVS